MTWKTVFDIIEILVASALMVTVLLQNRGAGLGGMFGQQSTVFRTRRGLERILYRATIALSIVFVVTSLASVRAHTVTFTQPPVPLPDISAPVPLPPLDVSPQPTGEAAPAPSPAAATESLPAPAASPAP